ncbi:MAG: heliorhodopsin HeR [Acidimicrobiales bacterium]
MAATTIDFDRETVPVTDGKLGKLRRFNLVMGVAHLISGALMLILGNDFKLEVSAFSLNGPPGTPLADGTINSVFDVPLAAATAAFLLLSALFHFIIAAPAGFGRYSSEIRRGRNRFRWVEYSISSTLMILLIGLVTGITDLAALIALAFANVSMILFGWIMEMVNAADRRTWWTPFWFGCIAGIGPWAAIAIYIVVNVNQPGGQGPPGFVYGIIFSLFFFFNTFAINQWLQYRQVGRWADYTYGETVYIVLSLVAKSVLAWQIFANTLIG